MTFAMLTTARQTLAARPARTSQARIASRVTARRSLVVRADKDPEKAAKDAGKNVSEGVEGALNKGKDALKDLSGRAESAADDFKGEAKGKAGDAKSGARDAADKAESEGKGLGDSLKKGVSDAADSVKKNLS